MFTARVQWYKLKLKSHYNEFSLQYTRIKKKEIQDQCEDYGGGGGQWTCTRDTVNRSLD